MKRILGLMLTAWVATGCSSGGGLPVTESPAELTDFEARLELQELWSADAGGGVGDHYLEMGPLVADDAIYTADVEGRVSAFERDSGKRLWTTSLEAGLSGGPGDGGDRILLGGDAEVFAVSKTDGSRLWRADVSSEVLAPPVRRDDIILVRTVDGNLFGLDAASGEQRWSYNQPVPTLSLRGVGAPAFFDGHAVAGFANGRLVAVNVQTGTPVWGATVSVPRGRTELERMVDVDAAPVIREGVAHVAAYQGRIATVALRNGQLLWTRDIPSHKAVGVTREAVLVIDDSSDVWALARYNGGTLWRSDKLHARRLTAPVPQGDFLVVGDLDGYLHWLSQADGSIVARDKVGSAPVLAAPVVDGDQVFVIDADGRLAAFRVQPN
ncbi:outer membrane protein assembly factor BamB [Thiohalomonas denitrificans]|uniref:Outer membrane protein assembly factor BamB n=1 Tax=Thiohalomonas denitrificans TaxID=415747 RepID=A0A1G5Q1J7_9GAMM|nr:outer membrane protein assembly factor BamB [Thiohalomonas denitrificans]SCZ55522.1 Beta-barrel assembly machine subunit BamB [Thiohalomonas denitrificans]